LQKDFASTEREERHSLFPSGSYDEFRGVEEKLARGVKKI